jgi:putative pyoverdin transport system ATP-binding/permease protein
MSFLQLVRRETQSSLQKLVFMSSLSGISNATILAAINQGAHFADESKKASVWAASLFIISLFLFIKTQAYVTTTITAEIEAIIHRLRVRLMDQVRSSELLKIEQIGRARIVAAITSDAAVLTQASNMLCYSMQSFILIFFVAIYVAYLSLVAFALSILIVGASGTIFHIRSRRLNVERAAAAGRERQLFDRLTDFLDGFKEVRLNSQRSADLFDDAVEVSRAAANIKIRTQTETFRQVVSAQSSMYILLGAVVFAAPQFSASLGSGSITMTTTALLFVVGACFGLVQSIPVLMNANAAADRMSQLEVALQSSAALVRDDAPRIPTRFDSIEMHDITFRYVDRFSDTAFHIGPLDFSLRSGDLVFITGGNGSGKSTFLKVLAGLYPPDSGEISLDGMPVHGDARETYRGLMSAIFYDYHLFKRLYGIPGPDPEEVRRLLTKFRLADKTSLSDGEFRTLELSGGQRRRLALIVSLLEKRPIILLDEWTAEQDPEFRRKFYDELLPEMMQVGATVVVITHDDRYLDELHLRARRIRMDEGRIVEQRLMNES